MLFVASLFLSNADSLAGGICKRLNDQGQTEFLDCVEAVDAKQSQVTLDETYSNSYSAPTLPTVSELEVPETSNEDSEAKPGTIATAEPASDALPSEISDKEIELVMRSTHASAEKKQERLQKLLDESCERARRKELEVDRVALVMECIEGNQKETPADCVAFYEDYGETAARRRGRNYRGQSRTGLSYTEISECVRAYEAERMRPKHRNGLR